MFPTRFLIRTVAVGCVFSAVALTAAAVVFAQPADDTPAEKAPAAGEAAEQKLTQEQLDAKVAALIKQLGADQYAVRERAHQALEDLGLDAFDALYDAKEHPDLEIRSRARYLVRSMGVQWSRKSDPPEVHNILDVYGGQNSVERKSRMDQLALLEDSKGVNALCRLARYESNDLLSKHAAIIAITHDASDDPAARKELSEKILRTLGASRRRGVKWLRLYAETLTNPRGTLNEWQQIAKEERDAFTQFPEKSDRKIVRDLLRWQVELLLTLNEKQRAIETMKATIDLLDGSREQLLEVVDWLLEREAWDVMATVEARYQGRFATDPLLLYRMAEAARRQNDQEAAEAKATKAFNLLPEAADDHLVAADALEKRGLIVWAEREYRHVLKISPMTSPYNLRARLLFSEMLHDHENDLEAGQVLEEMITAAKNDPKVMQAMQQRLGRDPGGVKSRMHFFLGLHYQKPGSQDLEKSLDHYRQGIKDDPGDADLLIAMYRAEGGDKEFKATVKTRMDAAIGNFRTQIAEHKKQLEKANSESLRAWAKSRLAMYCNQYAWLVGNTEGDFKDAIAKSHRSLELRPAAAGYLDTLGHCYFAAKDYKNAVKYQSRAVELEPHSGQIGRALIRFKAALDASSQQSEPEKESQETDGGSE